MDGIHLLLRVGVGGEYDTRGSGGIHSIFNKDINILCRDEYVCGVHAVYVYGIGRGGGDPALQDGRVVEHVGEVGDNIGQRDNRDGRYEMILHINKEFIIIYKSYYQILWTKSSAVTRLSSRYPQLLS